MDMLEERVTKQVLKDSCWWYHIYDILGDMCLGLEEARYVDGNICF